VPFFATLQPTAFDGLVFPCREYTVTGGVRDAVHEFPHADGGLPELLGRKLYTVKMRCVFDTAMKGIYAGAMDRLTSLRALFNASTRAPLMIPSIGEIDAYAMDWEEAWTSKVNSGETFEITFREYQASDVFSTGVQSNYQAISASLDAAILDGLEIGIGGDFFGSIQKFTNSINAVADQGELMSEIYSSKVQGLANECRSLITRADELQQPKAWKVLADIRTIGVAAIRIHEDLLQKLRNTFLFTVPTDMDLFAISRAMYGDTSKVRELLLMNAIVDLDLVPRDTIIRGYLKAA
jgi:prophage DNA circulation protein